MVWGLQAEIFKLWFGRTLQLKTSIARLLSSP